MIASRPDPVDIAADLTPVDERHVGALIDADPSAARDRHWRWSNVTGQNRSLRDRRRSLGDKVPNRNEFALSFKSIALTKQRYRDRQPGMTRHSARSHPGQRASESVTQDTTTNERVYSLLKAELLGGQLDLHTRLDFAELASAFGVSTTPVREAAMRLQGEGMLELHPKGGLRPAHVAEHRLRAILDLHAKLIRSALDSMIAPIEVGDAEADDIASEHQSRLVFRAIVRATGNAEFVAIVERISDRLAPFRAIEHQALPGVDGELTALRSACDVPAQLRRQVRAYHRRRLGHVAQLVWLVTSRDLAVSRSG